MVQETLSALADQYGSDKGAAHGDRHRYASIIDLLLGRQRDAIRHVVEIGLARGGHEASPGTLAPAAESPSVRMWLDFFPKARITGIDHADFAFMAAEQPRFRFLRADAGSVDNLRAIAGQLGNEVDLLIDDASHASYHQQLALRELFDCLRPGGLYLIEDLHWQPAALEASLPLVHRTSDWIELFRQGRAPVSSVWRGEDIAKLQQSVDCCTSFRDTQVPGGRYISALAIFRKR